MTKYTFILLLAIILTTGCSRTFVLEGGNRTDSHYSTINSYTAQGVLVQPTNNWSLGNTGGVNSVYYESNTGFISEEKLNVLSPDLTVNFIFNSTEMYPDSIVKLSDFIEGLEGGESLKLVGYTDNLGSQEVNLLLSKQRAQAIENIILNHKNLPIKTLGRGLKSPIADNQTEEGRQLNRRVEVYVNE